MSFNQFENMLLEHAIRELEKQLIEKGEWPEQKQGQLYLGGSYTFFLLPNQRLTILSNEYPQKPRKDIIPVNCYNLYTPRPIAEAVQEFLDRQKNPEKYMTPFFIE